MSVTWPDDPSNSTSATAAPSFLRTVRALGRAFLAISVTAFVYSSYLLGKVTRLSGKGHGWRNGWFRWWSIKMCGILHLRRSATGTPKPGVFLVSNHLGYVDIILIASFTDAVFVAKSEVADWPFIGMICRGIDTIFINRSSKKDVVSVGEEIERRLETGLGVVVFPEGTSGPGDEVLPFRSSLLEAAARDRLPVYYATLKYSVPDNEPPVSESVAWWRDMKFLPHLWDLMKLRELNGHVTFGEEPIVSSDRKELAARLQAAVAGQL